MPTKAGGVHLFLKIYSLIRYVNEVITDESITTAMLASIKLECTWA